SVPYALRVHDFDGRTTDPENIERVRKLLGEVGVGEDVSVDELVSPESFDRGRRVLVSKCITCHDMRTVLAKPRTAKGWYSINLRMLEKPAVFGEAIEAADLPYVTAYLVAITPDIQRSAKSRRAVSRELMARSDRVVEAMHDAVVSVGAVDEEAGEELLQTKCVECHELDDVSAHGGDDAAGWRSVIAAMVEEGAELGDDEISLLTNYLALKHPVSPEEEAKAVKEADAAAAAVAAEEAAAEKAAAEKAKAERAKAEAEGKGSADKAESKPKPKSKPRPKPKGDRKAGRVLFMAKCKACHGADGKGDTMFGSKIDIVSLYRTRRSRSKIRSITANGVPGTKMKPYEGKLSDTELDDVAAFVKTLR
ncbi:MAG TPA: c-type cytochrome, partial [Nannocystis exedens]|nr:c-type cytochrome [Nannocystis exedens]